MNASCNGVKKIYGRVTHFSYQSIFKRSIHFPMLKLISNVTELSTAVILTRLPLQPIPMETVVWVMILFTPPLVEAFKIVNGSLGDACLYWGWSVRGRRYVTSAKWDIEVSHWPPSSSEIISVLNETHFSRVNCVFDNYIYTKYKSANNLKWHMVSYSHFVARTKDIRVLTQLPTHSSLF